MVPDSVEDTVRKRHAKFATGEAVRSVVVPIGKALPVRQRVLTDAQVRDILTSADLVAVTNCNCRTSLHRCDTPLDVCIVVGDMARSSVGNPVYRVIGMDEALSILDRTSELGLVHMSIWAPGHVPEAICSCCRCCCSELRAMSEFGFHDYVVRSDFVADLDSDACTGCGTCEGRCAFGAIKMVDDAAELAIERCFGCGACVTTCPSGALSLSGR
jgi:formate hydrogenlyase subunit 6/NADH:ubiquinone oxidoreductase subunit I